MSDNVTININGIKSNLGENGNSILPNGSLDSTLEIPDLDVLSTQLKGFFEYFIEQKYHKTGIPEVYYGNILNVFQEKFPDVPFSVIKMVIDNPKDLKGTYERVKYFILKLRAVKAGVSSINEVHAEVCEGLNEQYIYSKNGGKDNFHKKLDEYKQNNTKDSK